MVTCVKFSEDGKSLNFHSKNGSVSMDYYSKESSLKNLFDLDLNKRIEKIDYLRIRKEITSAKFLPMMESLKENTYHHLLSLRDNGLIDEKQYQIIKEKIKNSKSFDL